MVLDDQIRGANELFHWVFEPLWRKIRLLPNLGKTTEIFLFCFVTLLLDDDNPVENRRSPGLQTRVLCSQTSTSFSKKVNSLKLRFFFLQKKTSLQALSQSTKTSVGNPTTALLPTTRSHPQRLQTLVPWPLLCIHLKRNFFPYFHPNSHSQNILLDPSPIIGYPWQ